MLERLRSERARGENPALLIAALPVLPNEWNNSLMLGLGHY